MRKIVLLTLLLSGCGGQDMFHETAPGYALPDQSGLTVNWCEERDEILRCKKWASQQQVCVNPKGIDVKPPTVWCNYIKDGVLQDKPVDGNYHDKK